MELNIGVPPIQDGMCVCVEGGGGGVGVCDCFCGCVKAI